MSARQNFVAIVGVLFLALTFTLTLTPLRMFNNGDGWRVLNAAEVDGPAQDADRFGLRFPMSGNEVAASHGRVQDTAAAALAEGLGAAARAIGIETFDLRWLAFIYFSVWLAGLLVLLRRTEGRVARILIALAALMFLGAPIGAGLFLAPYEEAAAVALQPIWLALLIAPGPGPWAFGLLTALLFYAKTAMLPLILPAAAFLAWHYGRRAILPILIMATVAYVAVDKAGDRFGHYNDYNRLYAGIAHAMAGWRSGDAPSRENADLVDAERIGLDPVYHPHWGLGYWDGEKQFTDAELQEAGRAGAGRTYFGYFARVPELVYVVPLQAWAGAITADYRIYMAAQDPPFRIPYTQFLGWVFPLALIGAAIALVRRDGALALTLAALFMGPVLVVVGDGFWDYARHLDTYVNMIPLSFALVFRRRDLT